MTETKLKELCKKHDLFRTPAANERLYANCCGFAALGGLEGYVNLKTLFVECNALDSLEGLPPMPHLKCFFSNASASANMRRPRNMDTARSCAAARAYMAAASCILPCTCNRVHAHQGVSL